MLDRDKPLDVCKIEARKQVEHKIKHDNVSMAKALKAISTEADIPLSTLKKWIYPNGSQNYNVKRRRKKTGTNVPKSGTTCITSDTTIDSIVVDNPELIRELRSIAKQTGMEINTIIGLGIESYKSTYL